MKKNNFPKKLLVSFFCFVSILFLTAQLSFSQVIRPNRLSEFINNKRAVEHFKSVSLFTAVPYDELFTFVKTGIAFSIDQQKLHELLLEKNNTITMILPEINGRIYELELAKVEILDQQFKIGTKGIQGREAIEYTPGLYYRGIIKGDVQSVASVSFLKNEVMGVFSDQTGNYNLGPVKDQSGLYVLYNDKDQIQKPVIDCKTLFHSTEMPDANKGENPNLTVVNCKVVKCYFECDFAMYQAFSNNTTSVTNYLTGAFNNEAALYQNEGISIQISQVFVWTSADPEAAFTTTSSVNSEFSIQTGSSFNGNMAQFLTTRNLGGGIAQGFNGLCNKSQAHSTAQIYTTYSSFPTYSWTVEVMTHEMGHLLGSRHTHACVWNGNNTAIDGCAGSVEGTCPLPGNPSGGGTIMSYCHLTGVGINFSNGFGPQPGGLILSHVNNASCLSGSSAGTPTGLATTNITNTSATLNWNPVSGASQYTVQYKVTTAGNYITLGNYTTTSATLTALVASASYSWRVLADCSPYSTAAVFSTVANPGCGVPTSLTSNNVTSTSAKVTWSAFANASSYKVRYKVAGTSTFSYLFPVTSSVTIPNLTPSTKYSWSVKTKCNNNTSAAFAPSKTFTTKSIAAPANYCAANGDNSTLESISNVTFAGVNNNSGDNGGYVFFTSPVATVITGTTYSVSVSLFKSNAADNENVRVWIDYNRDGDFADANELAYTISSTNAVFSGTITIPSSANIGFTRMRVTGQFGSTPVPCGTYQYGETEDYLVNITPHPATNNDSRIAGDEELPVIDFTIVPNPASTSIQLQISREEHSTFSLSIFSLTGEEVKKIKVSGEHVAIDASDLKNGFYQVRLTDKAGNTVVKKFIKN